MKILLSLVIAVIFSQAVYAQERRQTTEEVKKETYKHFLVNTHQLMSQVSVACESKKCQSLSEQGKKLLNKTVRKGQQGLVGQQELKQFHATLSAHLSKVVLELNKQPSRNQTKAIPKQEMFQFPSDGGECDLCSAVYEQAMGICSLYSGWGTPAAVICVAVSTIAYVNCLDRWCANSFFPDWYVNQWDDINACCAGEDNIDNGGEYIPLED